MIKQRAQSDNRRGIPRSVSSALAFALFLFVTSESFGDQPMPLTVEQPSKQPIVLTQGFSTTIHSERPFGKISITNPEIVDMVLQTDKSAVLIPEHLGRTNVDFLDDHGSVIGSMEIVVTRQSTTDRVVVYDHPTFAEQTDASILRKYPARNKPWRRAFPEIKVCSACLLNELRTCRPGAQATPSWNRRFADLTHVANH